MIEARFNYFASEVAGDFGGFGDGPAFGDEAGYVLACRQVTAFVEWFNV
ncbi:MAG: hypothetical protein IPK83_02190 [Planctomycetes bacterium]|nr:hypothetical protein [Planctomycetota bacterium]